MPKDCTDWRKTVAELGNPKNTIEVLQKYQFHFAKKFGQNFLIDTHVLDKIVRAAEITPEDYVLEIGPGIGTLTQYLCESAKHVFAVEIDDNLIPILQDTLSPYDNVTVIHNDVLKLDINKLVEEKCEGKRIKVVANLPYYITTPILMGLFESVCRHFLAERIMVHCLLLYSFMQNHISWQMFRQTVLCQDQMSEALLSV